MNRTELEVELEKLNYPPSEYSFNRPFKGIPEGHCLFFDEQKQLWLVGYWERNTLIVECEFQSEDEACKYLLEDIKKTLSFAQSLKEQGIIPKEI